jgi:hypothetical protein
VVRSREILESIDKQVAEAQNIQKLLEIQRNLDTSGLDKMSDSQICMEYRNIDLTKYRLIYDGPLTLKLGDTKRFKTIDLHVVLLEDCIMLLQKLDDKYLLKFHTSSAANASVGSQGHKFCHSPVIKFSAMLVRPVATGGSATSPRPAMHTEVETIPGGATTGPTPSTGWKAQWTEARPWMTILAFQIWTRRATLRVDPSLSMSSRPRVESLTQNASLLHLQRNVATFQTQPKKQGIRKTEVKSASRGLKSSKLLSLVP